MVKEEICCILCLQLPDDAKWQDIIELQSPEGEKLGVQVALEEHFAWLQIPSKHKKEVICRVCWGLLSTFHQFSLRVRKSYEQLSLQSPSVPKSLETDSIKSEPDSPLVKTTDKPLVKRRRGRPRLCKRRSSNTATRKTEDALAEEAVSEYLFNADSELKKETSTEEPLLPVTNVSQVEWPKESNEYDRLADDRSASDCTDDASSESELPKSAKRLKRTSTAAELGSKETDDFIASNFKLSCCLCQCALADFCELKRHFRAQHQIRGYVRCCGKKLLKRCLLADHLHVHLDPEYFKCNLCDKVMADRRCLMAHTKNHEEGKPDRIYRCSVCDKSFYRRKVFERHQTLHVPAEECHFACTHCDKTFATEYLKLQHERYVHLNLYCRICDICGKSIRGGRVALRRHLEEHAGVAPSVVHQCTLCGITLTSKYGLARHMKVAHCEKNRTPQVCTICSKVSPSITAHRAHVRYLHSAERKFACPMCDKAFRRSIELKEHMVTHTGDVLYTCPHCPKTFNSNANMHSHRKKMHRKEWEENRLKKYPLATPNDSYNTVNATPDKLTSDLS